MSDESLPFEEGLFAGALALPPDERLAFVRRACGEDHAMSARVEALLRGHALEQGVLDVASPGEKAGVARALVPHGPANPERRERIGRYTLKRKLGEGGFGTVWLAAQSEPVRRDVALKIVRPGMDSREVVARFAVERQALALMDHPNIARVFDGGETDDGRPFFVMEVVPGIPITTYCDQHRLETGARLELFLQVCRAVQHAHQKGVIHRDLKPSNILVVEQEGAAVPKVIDFGIAKAVSGRLTDHSVATAFTHLMGTPAYMSPEQLGGTDLDTRSDIYNLGVLLYEMLTGQTPFDARDLTAQGLDHLRQVIREKEPPKPSTRVSTLDLDTRDRIARQRNTEFAKLQSTLRGDLDWIVMCCLEKERARRYDTANALARDLERHRDHEPVTARPPTAAYILRKTVRRHRVAFATGGAIAASLLFALVANAAEARRASAAEQAALAERARAEKARAEAEAHKREAETQSARSAAVAQSLARLLEGVGPQVARGRDTALLRAILDENVGRLRQDMANDREGYATLAEILGMVYSDIGQHGTAVKFLREALALQQQLYGPEHLAPARLAHKLGVVTERRKASYEAEPWLRQAYTIRLKLLGPKHPDCVETKAEFGRVLAAPEPKEGERLLREAIEAQRAWHGTRDPKVARWLTYLAEVSPSLRNPILGETAAREAIVIYRELFGSDSPEITVAECSLAKVLLAQKRALEAETVTRGAAERTQRLFGESHPLYSELLRLLGQALSAQRRLVEAEAAFVTSLALAQRHNLTGEAGQTVMNLKGLLEKAGRLADAERVMLEQVEFSRREASEIPLMVARDLAGLAQTQIEMRKYAEAEKAARESLELRARPDTDTRGYLTENARWLVGEALAGQRRFADAEPYFLQAYQGWLAVRAKHPTQVEGYVPRAFKSLVKLYRDWGRLEEAWQWKQRGRDYVAQASAAQNNRSRADFLEELDKLLPVPSR